MLSSGFYKDDIYLKLTQIRAILLIKSLKSHQFSSYQFVTESDFDVWLWSLQLIIYSSQGQREEIALQLSILILILSLNLVHSLSFIVFYLKENEFCLEYTEQALISKETQISATLSLLMAKMDHTHKLLKKTKFNKNAVLLSNRVSIYIVLEHTLLDKENKLIILDRSIRDEIVLHIEIKIFRH